MRLKSLFLLIILAGLCLCGTAWADLGPTNTWPVPIVDASGQYVWASEAQAFPVQGQPWIQPDPVDVVNLQAIGSTVTSSNYEMAFGDADGDSLIEMTILANATSGYTTRIFETNGYNAFYQVWQTTSLLYPQATGDGDGDGLKEVAGQISYYIQVWEAPAAGQYTTQMVWQSPSIPNVLGATSYADLDQDGHKEIIHSRNTLGTDDRLTIYENTGDNQFQQVFEISLPGSVLGTHAIGDFDNDGIMEIGVTNLNGDFWVLKSAGNDSLVQVYHQSTGIANLFDCMAAHDMDGNGKDEIVCLGSSPSTGWIAQIYEANAGSYTMVGQVSFQDNYFGNTYGCVGDFDHDGHDEFAMRGYNVLRVYGWNGQAYAEEQMISSTPSIRVGMRSLDANRNGYDEILWMGTEYYGWYATPSYIYEDQHTQANPNVTVILTPQSPPINLPAGGGTFSYTAVLTNHDAAAATFQVWNMVILPSGAPYGPVLGPLSLTLPAGASITKTRSQTVPGSAPGGVYNYVTFVGTNTTTPWSSGAFVFTKAAAAGDAGMGQWTSSESSARASIPADLDLGISPNPFNPTTALSYKLQATSQVSLRVYDTAGRLVTTLVDGMEEAGQHSVTFDGSKLASGIYLLRLTTGGQTEVQKLILMK